MSNLQNQEELVFPPSTHSQPNITPETYESLYAASLQDPAAFWAEYAQSELEWFSPWTEAFTRTDEKHFQWFSAGKLNITHNCLDRHLAAGRGEKTAHIALDENNGATPITYAELLKQVNQFANVLTSMGIEKGDRVILYMPLVLEQIVAMLACARLGAIHSVVFAGFSAPALQLRYEDTEAKLLICGTWTQRRGKRIDLLSIGRELSVPTLVVPRRDASGEYEPVELQANETNFAAVVATASTEFTPAIMDSEDPLFILYTSGTTGKPKGIVHTTGGYNLYTHMTTKFTFDLHDDDVYWCTADPGWITGHSYMVYGPLSVGATSVIAEGAPDYPEPDRWWKIVEKYGVTVLYTAPTAVRLLMKYGEKYPNQYDLSSLRVLGSVGEPINPAAWHWFSDHVGQSAAALVDTWWQTETGGHLLVTMPSMPQKPGWAGRPFLGIEPMVVDDHGNPREPGQKGYLVIKQPWPSAFRTCWRNDERYEQYWTEFAPYYFTGDFAIYDENGYIQVLGRSDDVLNIAGHRLGTAEVESALVAHESVAEAAVVAIPDDTKGESLVAFVTLQPEEGSSNESLENLLREHVKNTIGRFAHIQKFNFTQKLPKTRSGKIMRRLLRAQELGEEVGDTSTLED